MDEIEVSRDDSHPGYQRTAKKRRFKEQEIRTDRENRFKPQRRSRKTRQNVDRKNEINLESSDAAQMNMNSEKNI